MAEAVTLPPEERQALIERLQALGAEKRGAKVGGHSIFERLQSLAVDDPESPTDLATNPVHLEGFGVSRSA